MIEAKWPKITASKIFNICPLPRTIIFNIYVKTLTFLLRAQIWGSDLNLSFTVQYLYCIYSNTIFYPWTLIFDPENWKGLRSIISPIFLQKKNITSWIITRFLLNVWFAERLKIWVCKIWWFALEVLFWQVLSFIPIIGSSLINIRINEQPSNLEVFVMKYDNNKPNEIVDRTCSVVKIGLFIFLLYKKTPWWASVRF